MEELIRMVSQKVGIGEEQARTAVSTVVGFIKERLPEPAASQLEGFISGAAGAGGDLLGGIGGAIKGLGGMLGDDNH